MPTIHRIERITGRQLILNTDFHEIDNRQN